MNLRNPLMVGFGISNKATFQAACEHASELSSVAALSLCLKKKKIRKKPF